MPKNPVQNHNILNEAPLEKPKGDNTDQPKTIRKEPLLTFAIPLLLQAPECLVNFCRYFLVQVQHRHIANGEISKK